MQIQYRHWNAAHGWRGANALREPAQLVLYFGSRQALASGARYRELRGLYPDSHIVGCSTGGQIHGDDISDDEVVAVALRFAHTQVRVVNEVIESRETSRACGARLARQVMAEAGGAVRSVRRIERERHGAACRPDRVARAEFARHRRPCRRRCSVRADIGGG
ncbi:FIST N-terminal domain-containing protein [Bradyrhizobium manausense]|uniref:FIST N-terminal domain-containing protein n=1 Tax=Bradyrhizobium manausense TaxID=989370 RepID=UPI001BA742F0|nr:hypothetical protein [Bradyrhizobium manausense]